jgi:Glycosyl transferase family 11.
MIIVRIWEGLGNQLFQYAYARALKEKGFDVRLDVKKCFDDKFRKFRNDDLRQNSIHNFNITLPEINVEEYGKYNYVKRDNIVDKLIFNSAEHGLWPYKFYEEIEPYYCEKLENIKGNCYIKGWFQSERYFIRIRNLLLKELTPKKKIQISKELRDELEYKESVSLHVRRGDFVKSSYALNAAYYRKASEEIKKRYKNPRFLIFSDDLNWVRKNLDIGTNCIYVNEDRKLQDYEELLMISRCKSNIISNSTFGWWGAWLNNNPEKIVIAPRNYWKSEKIVPSSWLTI